MPTTRIGAPYLSENQSSPAVTHNAALDAIDAAAALLTAAQTFTNTNTFTGRSRFFATPPASTTQALVEIGNRALTGMSASGTVLGGNIESSFAGDYIKLLNNDAQVFRLGGGGAVEAVSFRQSGGSRGFNGGWAWFIATTTPATDADHTVGASEYIAPILQLVTGAWTTGRNVILPNTLGGTWIVVNNTAFSATFKTAAGSGIAVAAGRSATLRGNGTNILRVTADCDFSV